MENLMGTSFFKILLPLFALGMVVFVHEFGHFIVARLCGIKVLKFSIGFGPKIFSFTRGETEYCISWFFFGGYVKFAGDDIDEQGARTTEGGYYASEPWKRNLTALAGPLMNLIFALVLYSIIFVMGKPVLVGEKSTQIGKILESSPAQEAGLYSGDRILAIDDEEVNEWREIINAIILSRGDRIQIQLERNSEIKEIWIKPEIDAEYGVRRIGVSRLEKVIIGAIITDSSAEKAGLIMGDQILSLHNEIIYGWDDLIQSVQRAGPENVTVELLRDNQKLSFNLQAQMSSELGRYVIGIAPQYEFVIEYPNPFNAFWQDTTNIFKTLAALATRTVSPKGLAGPIKILDIIGDSARLGLVYFITILAMISINLGILNILPIPVLDGGHILLNTIEAVRGKAIDRKALIVVQNIFLVLLLSLIVFVTFNDIKRIGQSFFMKAGQTEVTAK